MTVNSELVTNIKYVVNNSTCSKDKKQAKHLLKLVRKKSNTVTDQICIDFLHDIDLRHIVLQ